MTIPSDFRATSATIGSSAITHPIYTFTINLDRLKSETVGPSTNQRTGTVLHPDSYQKSPDRSQAMISQHAAGNISLIPTLLGANIQMNDNGTITAYGQHAVYLKKTYADVANPLLTLTNSAPYTSA